MPYFEPTSLKDLKTKRTKRLLPCSKPKNQKRFLISIISTTSVDDPLNIKIHEKFFKDYGVSSVSCCFRTISRVQDSDILIKINETCSEFENNYPLDNKHDTILVECSSGGKVIYKNVHATITRKKDFVERQRKSKIDKSRAYKVLLVGFDSMSRMTFPRGMPKTFKLFHGKKEWIEMKGYTRVSKIHHRFDLNLKIMFSSLEMKVFRIFSLFLRESSRQRNMENVILLIKRFLTTVISFGTNTKKLDTRQRMQKIKWLEALSTYAIKDSTNDPLIITFVRL